VADHRPGLPVQSRVWRAGAQPVDAGPCVVTIGVFDGVHRGHRAVLARAAAVAASAGVPLVAVTFDPHPADVVRRGVPPTRLCSVAYRAELLQQAGADAVWVLPFTTELSRLPPEVFVEQVLMSGLAPVAVVVGADFRFGHHAAGTVATLLELGRQLGFEVVAVELVGRDGDRPWSSTAVRAMLDAGDVEGAADVLGRAHRVEGEVVHGDHRGAGLGFPTANLDMDERAAVPADGVYAGWLVRPGGARLPAAVSVGTNPTFDGLGRRVEAYVLDSADPAGPDRLDLYGEQVAVDFATRLRPMVRFESVGELVAQMHRDVAATRAALT
jgi:riboflavin kinase / FMN adenylyltransferase